MPLHVKKSLRRVNPARRTLCFFTACALSALAPVTRTSAQEAAAPALYPPTDADRAQLEQAVAPARTHDFKTSLDNLALLITAHPNWPDPLLLRAQVQTLQNEFEDARDSYQLALDLDPHNRTALIGIASSCLQLDEFLHAKNAAEIQLTATPSDGEAALLRASALIGLDQKQEAAKYLAALLASANGAKQPAVLAAIVPLQLKADDYAAAETSATQWIEAAPTADAYAYRADARRGQKKFDDAAADLVAGFKLTAGKPTYPLLYIGSQLLQDRGNIAQAITLLVDLLELVPGNSDVEKALDRAVVARLAQKAADKNDPDTLLVSRIDYNANRAAIENWEFADAVGNEKLGELASEISAAYQESRVIDTALCDQARALYPTYQVYVDAANTHFIYTLDPGTGWNEYQRKNAAIAIRYFRVAAAILSVRYARYTESDMFTVFNIQGVLDWATFQQGIRDGDPLEPNQRLITAYVTLDETDQWAALQAYSKPRYQSDHFTDSGYLSGPNQVLINRILKNPIRRKAALSSAMIDVKQALADGHPPAALLIANQMTKIAPEDPLSWVAQAKVLDAQGNAPESQKARDKALQLDPLCPDALLMQAAEFENLHKKDDALLTYNKAARGQKVPDPNDPPLVAQAIAARDKLEQDYTAADLQRIYAAKTDASYKDHEWLDTFVNVSRLTYGFNAPTAGAYEVLGDSALNLGKHTAAFDAYMKAMDIDPSLNKNPILFDLIGQALVGGTNYSGAVEAYNNALKLDPEKASYYLQRAKMFHLLQNYPSAVADFKTAIAKGADSPDIQLLLADCLTHTDPAAAAETYKGVLKNPGEPELMHNGTQRTVMTAKLGLYHLQLAAAAKTP